MRIKHGGDIIINFKKFIIYVENMTYYMLHLFNI